MGRKEYYIEFVDRAMGSYVMQTIEFDGQNDAVKWYHNNIDYIDTNALGVYLMAMVWDEDGESYDIEQIKKIK